MYTARPTGKNAIRGAAIQAIISIGRNASVMSSSPGQVGFATSDHLAKFDEPLFMGGSRPKVMLSIEDDYVKAVRKYWNARARKRRRSCSDRTTIRHMG